MLEGQGLYVSKDTTFKKQASTLGVEHQQAHELACQYEEVMLAWYAA